MNEAQQTELVGMELALRELWQLIVEYDLNTTLEDEAQAYDKRMALASNGEYRSNEEWARVLGVMEGVHLALGDTEKF